jgi:hypothetical protein
MSMQTAHSNAQVGRDAHPAAPRKLWVDDLRPAPEGWHWVKTSAETITALGERRWDVMSLDHDLGGEDTSRRAVLWLCENGNWPDEVRVHSANPVGVEWLTGMVSRYWEPAH